MGGGAKNDKKIWLSLHPCFMATSEEEIRLLHLEKQILTGLGEICRFFCRFALLQHLHTKINNRKTTISCSQTTDKLLHGHERSTKVLVEFGCKKEQSRKRKKKQKNSVSNTVCKNDTGTYQNSKHCRL
jgi:hypothetical protein